MSITWLGPVFGTLLGLKTWLGPVLVSSYGPAALHDINYEVQFYAIICRLGLFRYGAPPPNWKPVLMPRTQGWDFKEFRGLYLELDPPPLLP